VNDPCSGSLDSFSLRLAAVFDLDLTEAHAASLTAWDEHAVQDDLEEVLAATTVDSQYPHAWCEFPDLRKCDAGKLTTPA